MSVPAWPMPIHQTKLMMSNAQPTGTLLPQMPMPLRNRYPTETSRRFRNMNAIASVTTQANGWYLVSTTEVILLVTDSNV